jgi:S1-C subfamily serine protease
MGVVVCDLLLLAIIVAYTVHGWRSGFLFAISSLIGLVAGAVVAFFVVPLIGDVIPDQFWQVILVLGTAVVIVVAGHTGGAAIGAILEHRVRRRTTHVFDRIGGAIVNALATAAVLSILAASLASFGIPALSQTIARSTVLRTISAVEPDPVERFIAQVRSGIADRGLPIIREAFGGVSATPTVPGVATDSPALTKASESVVRIIGSATQCSQSQSGTGFVISPERVITNAHVVAGVADPTVEALNGQVLDSRVVYFDPAADIAVLAVTGLEAPALAIDNDAYIGITGAISGYPYGGPFDSSGAQIVDISESLVANIYGRDPTVRTVYTLAATIREGDSGGPFMDENGVVIGMVFARSADIDTVGFAMGIDELAPVAADAADFKTTISPGHCVSK